MKLTQLCLFAFAQVFLGCSKSSQGPVDVPPQWNTGPAQISSGSNWESLLRVAGSCTDTACPGGAYWVKPGDDLFAVGRRISKLQKYAQWSNQHFAVLIEPGTYADGKNQTFDLGYYTQVLGLADDISTLTVNPGIEVLNQGHITSGAWDTGSQGTACPGGDGTDPYCMTIGGLNNFWRGLENVSILGSAGSAPWGSSMRWAVSQASPLRNVSINGWDKLLLCDSNTSSYACGETSGGFMSNIQFTKTRTTGVASGFYTGSQQQWFARNSSLNPWYGGLWNMVALGLQGVIPTLVSPIPSGQTPPILPAYPSENSNPSNPYTTVQTSNTPVREKPYLIHDGANGWRIKIPGLRNTLTAGLDNSKPTYISVDANVMILAPGADASKVNEVSIDQVNSLNSGFAAGKHLIVMPGVYSFAGTLKVSKSSVILGLGFPALIAGNSSPVMDISAEQGVLLAGVIFEAGYQLTPTLLQVGDSKNSNDNSSNPNFLFDVFCRVAETQLTQRVSNYERQTNTCITINANNVVGDNLWLWRGDHDRASGMDFDPKKNLVSWNQDRAEHGLVVNGQNVTMYGLAVEHFRDYQTIWNANGGTVYFYQSEMPYDAPSTGWICSNPADTLNPTACASYVVNSAVTKHTAQGLGVYSYFVSTPAVMAPSAILAPNTTGIAMTNIVGRWLNGVVGSGIRTLVSDYFGSKCWGFRSTCNSYANGSCVDPNYQTPAIGGYPNDNTQMCGVTH